jgi:HEAT repeat protein
MSAIPLFLLVAVPSWIPPAALPDPDECVLRAAGVDCRTPGLTDFLLKRLHCDEKSLGQIDKLIEQLGAPKFEVREAALTALVRLGPAAMSALRQALQNPDLEVRAAARRGLQRIDEQESKSEPVVAAVRLLVRRGDARGIPALLACLPACEANGELEAEMGLGLYDLAARLPKVPTELLAALSNPSPARRAIAGCIVARRGTPAERTKVLPLLEDPVSTVRLRAAQGLLAAGDLAAVPALIALLDVQPLYEAWQADELLRWLAQGTAPDCSPVWHEIGGALAYRHSWEQWWKENREKIDFTAVCRQPRRPCLFMVSAPENAGVPGSNGLMGVIGCDGGYRGSPSGVRKLAQVLPNGRLLVVGLPPEQVRLRHYGEHLNQVMEIDWTGYVYWANDLRPFDHLVNCLCLLERLRDGRTHLVCHGNGVHTFLDQAGAMIATVGDRLQLGPDEFSQKPERAPSGKAALSFGHRLVIDPPRNRLVEFDQQGRMVGETFCPAPPKSQLQLVFPLLRLGFDDLPGRDYDLQTSIDERIRLLNSSDERDWYLAAKAIRSDFKPTAAVKAFPTLINLCGRGERAQRLYKLTCSAVSAQGELLGALLDAANEAIRTAVDLAESSDSVTRAGAISFLGAYELRGNQPLLRLSVIKKHLHDPSARVRSAAAGALGLFRKQREEVAAALKELLDDQEKPWPGTVSVGTSAKWALEAVCRDGPAQ